MKTDLPPLNWLKTFEVAARLLNFSAAARELHMTQSAVSQQIKLLEHHLGDELFIRKHRKVSLSNSGLAYLPAVQTAIHGLQRDTSKIFSSVSKGRLVIEANFTFSSLWLARNLYRFCLRYPGIKLQLVHSNLDNSFFDKSPNLAIINGHGKWEGLTLQPLLTAELKLYCSPKIAQFINTPDDIFSLPLLDVVGVGTSWPQWFEAAGIDDTQASNVIYHKVDNAITAILMAESGLGVMLGYPDFFKEKSTQSKLVAPLDTIVQSRDNFFIASPEGKPLSQSAILFKEWLLHALHNPDF